MLELSEVWKTYDGKNDVLRGVSLRVEKGEVVVVSGGNGCGKTTLLNIAGCLDSPTKGKVSVDGREVGGMKESELSEVRLRKVGFVFQDCNLIDELTVAQNVMLPLRLARAERREEKAGEMLAMFGIEPLSQRRPQELSTGQRQLVSVARALANSPGVLLADEPVAALDEENTAAVVEALTKANEETGAAVIVTHHDSAAQFRSSRGFGLVEGKLLRI